MTKTDREFVELTAEVTATKIIHNALEGVMRMVQEHEAILNNGLRKEVKRLNGSIENHIIAHKEYVKDKIKGKRKFWTILMTGIIIGITSGVGSLILSKLF